MINANWSESRSTTCTCPSAKTKVLTGVNLTIEPGEFFAFLGPSGSGKIDPAAVDRRIRPRPEGDILIGGENVANLPPWKRNVGMVFQSYALWPH